MDGDTYAARLARANRDVRIAQATLERALDARRREIALAALAGNPIRRIAGWAGVTHPIVVRELRKARKQATAPRP